MTDDAFLDTVRVARDFGTVAELYPEGVDDLRDLPFPLFNAIRAAMVFISWDTELPKEERPPKRIWLDEEKLSAWFEEVDRRRKQDMKGGGIEDPVENEAAKELLRG